MSGLLFRLLDLASRHRVLVSWLIGSTAAVAIASGVVVGADRAPSTLSLPADDAADARPATVAARATSLQGVVLAVRPLGFTLLQSDGNTVVVVTGPLTQYRRDGKAMPREQLRRGQQVVVLGRVQPNGRLRAKAVAVRGEIKRTPSPSPAPVT